MRIMVKINGVVATPDDRGRMVFDLVCKKQRAIARFAKGEINIITEV